MRLSREHDEAADGDEGRQRISDRRQPDSPRDRGEIRQHRRRLDGIEPWPANPHARGVEPREDEQAQDHRRQWVRKNFTERQGYAA